MKTKTFDSVEMKRNGSAIVYEKIKDMTMEEELAFWKEKTQNLRREQQLQLNKRKAA